MWPILYVSLTGGGGVYFFFFFCGRGDDDEGGGEGGGNLLGKKNAISPVLEASGNKKYWCYYPHWSRDPVSPVCVF